MIKKYPYSIVKSLAHKNKFYDPNPEWMNPKWRLQKKFDGVEMEEPPLKMSPSKLDKINELAEEKATEMTKLASRNFQQQRRMIENQIDKGENFGIKKFDLSNGKVFKDAQALIQKTEQKYGISISR